MQQMTFCGDARWSVILADQFGLEILNMSEIKVQVLHRVQAILLSTLCEVYIICQESGHPSINSYSSTILEQQLPYFSGLPALLLVGKQYFAI